MYYKFSFHEEDIVERIKQYVHVEFKVAIKFNCEEVQSLVTTPVNLVNAMGVEYKKPHHWVIDFDSLPKNEGATAGVSSKILDYIQGFYQGYMDSAGYNYGHICFGGKPEIPKDIQETEQALKLYDFKKVFRINKWESAVLIACDPKGQPLTFESRKKKRVPQIENKAVIPTWDLTVDTPGSSYADNVDACIEQATLNLGKGEFDLYAVLKAGGLEVGIGALKKHNGYYRLATDFKGNHWH